MSRLGGSRLGRVALAGALAACTSATSPDAGPRVTPAPSLAPQAPVNAPQPLESPYPPGRWRQQPAAMRRLVLWPSHILVRFAGAPEQSGVSFARVAFQSVLPPATRSRGEALALARDIVRAARAEPGRFAELSRQHSEDIVRREQGGSLGGIPAEQLAAWPTVLDALLALAPGQVSDVVETRYGFHVFTRRAPPPRQMLTGRRIVIGHERAPWLGTLDASAPPTRTREAALELARTLFERARSAPERFEQLVALHSELRDRIVGGDFGTWSSVEPCPLPREVEVLSQLEVGEVAPPFDSLFGIQIVQRVPNPQRSELAIDGINLPFDRDAPDGASTSRDSVLAEARTLNERLRAAPSLLPELQKQHMPFEGQWTQGRGSPELLAALGKVQPGDVLPEPVRSATRYIIGRRAVPRPPTAVEPLFELP
ncbi:MAG TPA: peptidylprolyl isomerase [Polyangiaceae bacterium]|nr:peptidylprolyl isomerase [Polyangiaceae bacterium]